MLINEKMLVSEILDMNPDVTEVFVQHGLNCLGCPGAHSESLKEAAEGHGISLEKLVEDLDKFLNKQVEK